MDDICKTLHIENKDIASIVSSEYKTYDKMKALECLVEELIVQNKFPLSTIKFLGEGSTGLAHLVGGFAGSVKLVAKQNDEQRVTDAEYLVGKQLNVLRQYTPCFHTCSEKQKTNLSMNTAAARPSICGSIKTQIVSGIY